MLRTLALGPRHGWGIAQRIRQISQDELRVNQGSLYPALHRLELHGWITTTLGSTDQNRRVRLYKLTAAGRKQMSAETETWRRLSLAIGRVLEAT